MRHIISIFLIGLTVLLSGCGGGGGSSPANSSASNPEKQVELSSAKKADVTLAGTGGDTLRLAIPPLGAGTEDVNVTISLAYNGDLPEIVIDRDINFSAPVTLTFTSTHLVEGNTTLVYHAPGKTYYIPSAVVGHTLTATLRHFSKYGFDNLPTPSERLKEDIDSRLAAMKAKAENSRIDAFSLDDLNDLFVKISVYEDSYDFPEMLNDLSYIIEKASDNTLKYYQKTQLKFFSGMCPTDVLPNAMFELFSVYSFNDMLNQKYGNRLGEGDLAPFLKTDAKLAFEKVLKDSKDAWESIPQPQCGDSKLHTYIKCTRQYIDSVEMGIIFFPEASTVGMGSDIEGEMQIMIDQSAGIALDDGDCDCMLFYKDILNTYFAKALASTISRLDSATRKCGTRCPLLWDITLNVNGWYDGSPDIRSSGYAEWKNVYIEQRDDAWVDLPEAQRQACIPYQKNKIVKATLFSQKLFDDQAPEIGPFTPITDIPESEMTQESFNTFTIGSADTMPVPSIRPVHTEGSFTVDEDIYAPLNRFQTFTVSDTTHGTIEYTFTPHEPGFKYPKN